MNENELKNLLAYYDDLYYNQDISEISDAEYDALKKRYMAMIGGEYDFVPGEAQFNKFEHVTPVLSLGKVNTIADLAKEVKKLWPVILQPKLDGLTLVVGNGRCVTRGNGHVGELIGLNTARKFLAPELIDYPGEVRGEVLIPKALEDEINRLRIEHGDEPFKNLRNAAAGILRKEESYLADKLVFLAYNITGSALKEEEQLQELKRAGFTVPRTTYFTNMPSDFEKFCREMVDSFDRDGYEFEIDGLVVKSNLPNALNLWRGTSHHDANAIAYKYPPKDGKWTKLLDVTWQVGRTGKITPVAEIAPVDILGSTISRATLHNINIIHGLDLQIGRDVFVVKANDVIPAIIDCDTEQVGLNIDLPVRCPACGALVRMENDQVFCTNPHCSTMIVATIKHIAGRDYLNIEGLSEETAAKMYDAGLVKSPYDIFNLSTDDIRRLPGFAEISAKKLHSAIQQAKLVNFNRFIASACVPEIGRHAGRDIAEKFNSLESFLEDIRNGCPVTRTIEGIGDVMVQNLIAYIDNLEDLAEHVSITVPVVVHADTLRIVKKQLTFVITGTLTKPRSYFEDMIRNAGHKVSGSVSKKTDYLVCNEDKIGSSKMTKATKLGIPVVSEEQLKDLLN